VNYGVSKRISPSIYLIFSLIFITTAIAVLFLAKFFLLLLFGNWTYLINSLDFFGLFEGTKNT